MAISLAKQKDEGRSKTIIWVCMHGDGIESWVPKDSCEPGKFLSKKLM